MGEQLIEAVVEEGHARGQQFHLSPGQHIPVGVVSHLLRAQIQDGMQLITPMLFRGYCRESEARPILGGGRDERLPPPDAIVALASGPTRCRLR